jgi:DNA polymerase III subunit delta'
MAFRDFPKHEHGVELLQRSLERGRLGHAYLFCGHHLAHLEHVARTLSKTLNCQNPVRDAVGKQRVDSCDECLVCRKIDSGNHADIHWARPESKSRVIVVNQMRELMREIQLKPTEAEYKVAVIVAADRLKIEAANAFLKTLEEPPQNSILILLSTEPQRVLETIVSRCLRLSFGSDAAKQIDSASLEWLNSFGEIAASEQKSLLGRYRLLDVLVKNLTELKSQISARLKTESPLEQHDDIEKDLREKWEEELDAAIESEYRLQRSELLACLQTWLRDVWLRTLSVGKELLAFPESDSAGKVALRISAQQAAENLRAIEQAHRLLNTNVQEALALEVTFLKLHF